jgi:Spy/CpxP family protein refolding chaperone
MKKMIVLLAVAMMSQFVFAQVQELTSAGKKSDSTMGQGKQRHRMHQQEKRAMMKELNLTEDQRSKLKEMNAGNKEKKQAIVNNAQLTEEQKKEQLQSIRKAQAENMKAVLTDEQKAKMKEVRMKMKTSKKNGKGHRKAAAESKTPEAAPAPQNQ